MRLSKNILKIIKLALLKSFPNEEVYLFGSRVDDNKNGGDIDLAIKGNLSKEEFKTKKIQFFTELFKQDFDIKIDLVFYNSADNLLKSEIDKNGIKIAGK